MSAGPFVLPLREGERVYRKTGPGLADVEEGAVDAVGPLRFRVTWDGGDVQTFPLVELGSAFVRRVSGRAIAAA